MPTLGMEKLKNLLSAAPTGVPYTSNMLRNLGFSRQLVHQYVKSGWLTPLGGNCYQRTDEDITRDGFLWTQAVYIGGKSALAERGFKNFQLDGNQKLSLYGSKKTKLPEWFKNKFKCELITNKLFDELNCHILLNVKRMDENNIISPFVSEPERAFLEILDKVQVRDECDKAADIMKQILPLRIDVMQRLLEICKRIKVKRLFFYLDDQLNLQLKHQFDLSRIDFGADSDYIRTHKGNSLILKKPR